MESQSHSLLKGPTSSPRLLKNGREGVFCEAFNYFVIVSATLAVPFHMVPGRWASLLLLGPWGVRGDVWRRFLPRLGDLMPDVQPPCVYHLSEALPLSVEISLISFFF